MKKTIKYVEPTSYFPKEIMDSVWGKKSEKKTTKTTPKKKTK